MLVHDTLENLKARKRGAAEVVLAARPRGIAGRLPRAGNGPAKCCPTAICSIEHQADSLNPLLTLMHELKLPPLEIIPSPNALEETFVQALEISHAAA